ncbi:ImmA/IrrE family metallo-endopeptidase [Lysinibacillus pakistanensis]|uniref:ImmA/IrrE family metallo-endopeptidase n=1 Tax=Lysinibacillus pakistanensis TaxID=759811 RepID=UPI003D2BE912
MVTLTYTEEFIKALYLKIGMTKPLSLNLKAIVESLGIHVFHWPEKSQALFFGDTGYIMLHNNLTPQQQWQDFCHELAHVLLHTGDQGSMSPLFREYQENKANNFMYHACVPSFMLEEIEPSNFTVEFVQQKFNMEFDFALKRLEQYHNKRHYSELE